MPLIELGETVLGCAPSAVTVTRFTETDLIDGRAQPPEVSTFTVKASIQPLENEELLRLPEGDRTEGGVAAFTVGKLLPKDQFSYNGITYEVSQIEDWFELGGYYKSIAKKVVL